MATLAQSVPQSPRPLAWFQEFLKEELVPYPGRFEMVARMVLAATLIMIVTFTFRIPYGFQGAIYALVISRDNPQATLRSAGTIVFISGLGAAYILASAWFFASVVEVHFLWTIGTFFIYFYAVSTTTNYNAVVPFANLIALAVPVWDRHVPAETNVEDTLWALYAVLIGGVITALVELAFVQIRPGDDLVRSIAERLTSVEKLLTCYIADRPVDEATEKKVTRFAMLGVSRQRSILRRSTYSRHYGEQMGAVVSLVARLVDLAANLIQLGIQVSGDDRQRIRGLAASIASIRADLLDRRVPSLVEFNSKGEASGDIPLLSGMERTVSLIPEVFSGSRSMSEYGPSPSGDERRSTVLVSDALSNPEHLKFALKGCLAASLCYIIYNSVDWPGISTAVTSCLLTALSTIGASRQKQVLRFTGAIAGGFLFGLGSQIFILPHLDSVGGFTVLFVVVTGVAAWFMTCTPRLSYFGLQIAVAFYLINLQEFKFQTSLAVARDRVLGILLGLLTMWLVFDHLWSAPAAVEMRKTFISALRLLAQFAREPTSKDLRAAIERAYSLRDTINATFDTIRSLADGVLFEFGPSRQQNLALRSRIRRWGPQQRMIFVTRTALWKYRVQLPGFELPKPVAMAQQEFDEQLARALERMADRMEGKASEVRENLQESLERLEQTIRTCCPEEPQEVRAALLQTFLPLSRRIESLTISLDKEI